MFATKSLSSRLIRTAVFTGLFSGFVITPVLAETGPVIPEAVKLEKQQLTQLQMQNAQSLYAASETATKTQKRLKDGSGSGSGEKKQLRKGKSS